MLRILKIKKRLSYRRKRSTSLPLFRRETTLLIAGAISLFLSGTTALARQAESGKNSVFLEAGGGIGPAVYRDKATSPLFYAGPAANAVLNHLKFTETKETTSGVQVALGVHSARVSEGEAGESLFTSLSFSHTRLYQLPGLSGDKWSCLAGGTLVTTGNVRFNEALFNNAAGLEAFANLMGAFKVSRDISRREETSKKLWFIRYRQKPKQRNLSFQLNAGLWNNSYRNGYAYINHYGLVNDPKVFGDYRLKAFSGIRFTSELHYTLWLRSAPRNGMRFSYVWDALTTASGSNAFNAARHILRFTLLYNTK